MVRAFLLAMLVAGAGCTRTPRVPVEQVQVSPVTAQELLKVVRDSGAKVVLVNVWATWCGPCQEEFPDLVRVARDYQAKGLKVLLVSADMESDLPQVKKFLAEHGVNFPTYLQAEKDQEFVNGIEPRWTGAIPATFIYDGTGKLSEFWERKASYAEFEQEVRKFLK
jgi:thiol-disulfide isomerase/thioredoxin